MESNNITINTDKIHDDFILKVNNYLSAINKLLFIKILSTHFFTDFPKNLSEDVKLPLEYIPKLFQGIVEREYKIKKTKGNEFILELLGDSKTKLEEKLIAPVELSSAIIFLDAKKVNGKEVLKFRDTISKELIETSNLEAFVMLFSYFDSYLRDCLFYIYKVKPTQWQKKHVRLNYLEIKEKLTEEQVLEKHIEQNVSRNIYTLMESICKKLKTEVKNLFTQEQIKLLRENIEVRNIIVHNFGIIDNKFKSKVETNYEKNDRFPITSSYVNKSFDLVNEIMFRMFKEISSEIFKKDIRSIIKKLSDKIRKNSS